MDEGERPQSASRDDFELADWRVRPSLNRLSRGGRTAQLEPKLMDVLVYLAENAGRVVSKIEITDAIQSLTLTQLMKSCYDSSTFPNSDSCGAWVRDAGGQVIDFTTGQANAALFDYEQLELGFEYGFEVANFLGRMRESWAWGSGRPTPPPAS